jgi:hypothetical protein
MSDDDLITVCDVCRRASCWHGDFVCDAVYEVSAGTIQMTRRELLALNLEHPSYLKTNDELVREGDAAMRPPDFVIGVDELPSARIDRQSLVGDWVRRTFGDDLMCAEERVSRVLEEAIELAQAEGLAPSRIHALIDHVYSKEPGDRRQEVGGLEVTILAYCATTSLSVDECEAHEIARVLSKPAGHFRERQAAKASAGIAMPPGDSGKVGKGCGE